MSCLTDGRSEEKKKCEIICFLIHHVQGQAEGWLHQGRESGCEWRTWETTLAELGPLYMPPLRPACCNSKYNVRQTALVFVVVVVVFWFHFLFLQHILSAGLLINLADVLNISWKPYHDTWVGLFRLQLDFRIQIFFLESNENDFVMHSECEFSPFRIQTLTWSRPCDHFWYSEKIYSFTNETCDPVFFDWDIYICRMTILQKEVFHSKSFFLTGYLKSLLLIQPWHARKIIPRLINMIF